MEDNTQTRLSAHFTLEEMCRSGAAIKHHISNTPDKKQTERLRQLCLNVLEPLRRRFGVIRITSGFRSERLNAIVGGADNSQHMRGEAADIHISNMETGRKMYEYIEANLDFDQLLFEHSMSNGACWLHVSYKAVKGLNRHDAVPFYKAA